ncbi:AB hydrolase superfamily protein C4A8.06c [Phlyctema vagabunda]|uniref:AB hydrolase superfamily protein C4A8.06c n=1 Tax=Phlyctema vagabunda TaxID=108571 RepID=A0ABR4PFF0_9HELO
MVFNTASVGTAVTPAVISTFISHYLNRKPLANKPTAHISYDEGIHLIRQFLAYASHHSVEDVQRFTSQWVPHPHWVKVDEVTIPSEHIDKAATAIQEQLGHHGIQKVGGKTWWQWRRPDSVLKAEWIEMKSDYQERKKNNDGGKRIMLYVHGGAYFFGSVDEHRYQLQRHARKLKARVFAPRYRLAPQFPFPCGLHDCLAAYMYLLTVQDPTTIIIAGDSAGGGMVMSMLVCMRDRGIPLPAGAILISPWVDLTHSFPSVAADNPLDYIPPHGFHQRPSPSWPPPNADDMLAMEEEVVKKLVGKDHSPRETEADAIQGFHVDHNPAEGLHNDTAATATVSNDGTGPVANTIPGPGHDISIMLDGNLVEIKDQIQMYATNQLVTHPLVSPILQPSLGGLPPLLILVGGGEMLRDEQIYLAHKAANPSKYPPGDAFLDESPFDHNRDQVKRWKPTDVQLQVWDDLCHVAPTLSFTRPAKYMYRSIAQFGAWALARAQNTEIEILDDDDVSVISRSSSESDDQGEQSEKELEGKTATGRIGKAGDSLPPFKNHMIRQRVDRHGDVYPLEPASELPACTMSNSEIGVIKEGPVRKWMKAKKEWDTKYASSKRRVQKKRAKEMANGYLAFGDGEVPPPSALAGRRKTGVDLKEDKKKKSMGMSIWSLWNSKHDEKTMDREQEADKAPETSTATSADGAGARDLDDTKTKKGKQLDAGHKPDHSRSRSRRRTVTDENQTGYSSDVDENTSAADLLAIKKEKGEALGPEDGQLTPDFVREGSIPHILVKQPSLDEEYDLKRPKAGGIAFPFTLKQEAASASMTTLTSAVGVPPTDDVRISGVMESGVQRNSTDIRAVNSTEGGKESLQKSSQEAEKVVEAGELVSAARPPLETFETAREDLPTSSRS